MTKLPPADPVTGVPIASEDPPTSLTDKVSRSASVSLVRTDPPVLVSSSVVAVSFTATTGSFTPLMVIVTVA